MRVRNQHRPRSMKTVCYCAAKDTSTQQDLIDWDELPLQHKAQKAPHSPLHCKLPSVNISTLNVQQKTAYNIVR